MTQQHRPTVIVASTTISGWYLAEDRYSTSRTRQLSTFQQLRRPVVDSRAGIGPAVALGPRR